MERAPGKLHNLTQSAPHIVLCGVLAALLGLAEVREKVFHGLLQEDAWAEWTTFAAFSTAAVLGLRGALVKTRPVLTRVSLLGLSLFCLFVAGEEISWGQRLFGYRPPDLFLAHNFQQEANLHNLLKDLLDTRFMVMGIAVLYGVLLPFLAHVTPFPRQLSASLRLLPYFAFVAWLELSYPYELVGELAELVLGLLFLVDVIERTSRDPTVYAKHAAVAQAAVLSAGVLLVPLNDGLVGLHAEQFAETARVELAHLADEIQTGTTLRTALFRKKHIHKRLYTAARAGYLTLPPDEYALDPWNNPYWIAFRRGPGDTGKVLIYSFGANHRRETAIDEIDDAAFALAGDDLGVIVDVSAKETAAR